MKLRGWITLGLVLIYGLLRSELVAQADGTFLAQLAPAQIWARWKLLLTSGDLNDQVMLLLASGAFLIAMLCVWWRPLMRWFGARPRHIHQLY